MQNDELRLVLFTSQSVDLKLDEFVKIFRHRNILLYYFVPISILALTNVRGGPSEVPVWFSLSVYMFGTFVMICAILAQVALLRWAIRRPQILTLHMTPMMILALCCSTTAGEVIVQAYIGMPPNTAFQFAMLIVFYLIVTELQFAIATQFIVPGVLRELRGHASPPKDWLIRRILVQVQRQFALPAAGGDDLTAMAAPLDAPLAPAPSAAAPPAVASPPPIPPEPAKPAPPRPVREAAPVSPKLAFKDVTLPASDVLQIEAEGNYILIHTAKRRHTILMRFSQAVALMPKDLGFQVHRSHWIATSAIKGYRRMGRDILVRLETGAEVTVAQSRQAEVLPRLRAVLAERDV